MLGLLHKAIFSHLSRAESSSRKQPHLHMTARKKSLLFVGVVALGAMMRWRWSDEVAARRTREVPLREVPSEARQASQSTRVEPKISAAVPMFAPAATRREATELVRALYRKEQLTSELDLEQLRYGYNYWQSECSGRELAELQQAKESMLKQLSAEANQVLNDLFPNEAGEPITLIALFDTTHPGPNLTFLSPSLREQFESEILAGDGDRGVDRERLFDIATRLLPSREMASYRQWNDRPAAVLRDQLVGFNQTESEFVAILHEASLAEEDGGVHGTEVGLETQLGAARYADFLKSKDPAMYTALHDLQRFGLPLEEAEWLAATRTRAVEDIGKIWQSAALSEATKRERVAQTERAYGQTIAAKLALPEASLDGLNPDS